MDLNKYTNTLNEKMDAKLDCAISEAISLTEGSYSYTTSDLDSKINEDETLREYLEDAMMIFDTPYNNLDALLDSELNSLVQQADSHWGAITGKLE